MTLRVSDLQSDSDMDSIRNSCDVFREAFPYSALLSQTSPCLFVRKGTRHERSDDQYGDDDDDLGEIQNDFDDENDRYIMIMKKMAIKPR